MATARARPDGRTSRDIWSDFDQIDTGAERIECAMRQMTTPPTLMGRSATAERDQKIVTSGTRP